MKQKESLTVWILLNIEKKSNYVGKRKIWLWTYSVSSKIMSMIIRNEWVK